MDIIEPTLKVKLTVDQYLGYILGFYQCYHHDYSNHHINRHNVQFHVKFTDPDDDNELNAIILAFYCESDKIDLNLLDKWADHIRHIMSIALDKVGDYFNVDYKLSLDYSILTILEHISSRNFEFLTEHMNILKNLIWNYYPGNNVLIQRLVSRIVIDRNTDYIPWLYEFFEKAVLKREYIHDKSSIIAFDKEVQKIIRILE